MRTAPVTQTSRLLHVVTSAAVIAFLTACETAPTTAGGTDTAASTEAGAMTAKVASEKKAAAIDPITGDPIQGEGFAAYYGQWQVLFNSKIDASQFASLPKDKKAKVAAPQVLAAKHITNSVCPLTGEELTAAAAPVKYEGATIGFASVADANQFKSLKKEKQAQMIATWKASAKN